MNKSCVTAILIIIAITSLCVVGAGAVYFFTSSGTTPLDSPFKKVPNPPEITVETPKFGKTWRVNDNIPLLAITTGESRIMAFEVWIDGQLYGTRDDLAQADLNTVVGEWFWQPATLGTHSIMYRSVDILGLTTYSEIIQIQAVAAVEALQVVTPETGQTLNDVAVANNVNLQKVLDLNPDVYPAGPLPPGSNIFIPHAPVPVKAIDLSGLHNYEVPEVEGPAGEGSNVWIQTLPGPIAEILGPAFDNKPDSALPAAPTLIKAENQGACDVYLEFKDNSNNEDGFRIYKANPTTKDFTEDAELPPLITKNIVQLDKGLNVKGAWTYYAAAFNTYGESKSLPVVIQITDASCFPKEPEPVAGVDTSIQILDFSEWGVFTVDENVDQAYVYLTINGQSRRIPEGATFMQGSGYKFDLTKYLLSAVETLPPTTKAFHIKVELWGWEGNKPYLAGMYVKDITNFTILLGCMVTAGDACDSDNSKWSQNIVIPEEVEPASVNFRFKLISFNSFNVININMSSQLLAQSPSWYEMFSFHRTILDGEGNPPFQPYYFNESLAPYLSGTLQDPTYQFNNCLGDKECKSTFFANNFDNKGWFKMYYEIDPFMSKYGAKDPEKSNRVYIMHNSTPDPTVEQSTPQTPALPDLYQVEFVDGSYTPAALANPALWGCIRYLEDADGFKKGEIHCPPQIPENPCVTDEYSSACLAQMATQEWNIVTETYDFIVKMYAEAFAAVVKGITGVIPGCDSSDACKYVVQKAVEVVWTYITGLPTSMPTSDEVQAAGMDYIISYAVDETVAGMIDESGIKELLPADSVDYFNTKTDEFKQVLKDKIKDQLLASKRGSSGNLTVSCKNDDIAKSKGRLPLCPTGAWEPAPGSDITPPTIKVKITRKPFDQNNNFGTDPSTITPQDAASYGLKITSHTINTYRVGTIIPMYGGYVENYPIESSPCTNDTGEEAKVCYFNSLVVPGWWRVTQPLEAAPYKDIELPIPWMQPGENLEYTVTLTPNRYFYTSHLGSIHNIEQDPAKIALRQGDDWPFLYYFGETKLHVEEVCPSNLADKVFCGSSDDFSPAIPTNP